MHIALVSCETLPDWEVDDVPLHAALRARGAVVTQPVWSDASVDWSAFDLVLLRTPWDYQERLPAFRDWTRRVAEVTRLEHDAEVVRWNSRKTYLRDLQARGVPIAPTEWLDGYWVPDLAAVLARRGWTRAFLKPVVGATARETMRFDASSEGVAGAEAHLARLQEAMLLQPYLHTVETLGEWSVVVIDGVPTHGVRKVPVAGDYRVQDDFGAHDEPLALTPELIAFAEQVMGAARESLERSRPFLYGRVDLLHHEGGWVLNELEIIEPSLFFRHGAHAAEALADAVVALAKA